MDELIELAHRFGLGARSLRGGYVHTFDDKMLAAFAAAIRKQERERCAAVCEKRADEGTDYWEEDGAAGCAAAIRGLE